MGRVLNIPVHEDPAIFSCQGLRVLFIFKIKYLFISDFVGLVCFDLLSKDLGSSKDVGSSEDDLSSKDVGSSEDDLSSKDFVER